MTSNDARQNTTEQAVEMVMQAMPQLRDVAPDVAEAARRRALELIGDRSAEPVNREDLANLAALQQSIGSHIVQGFFRHMVRVSGLRAAEKRDARQLIKSYYATDGEGCLRVEFHDRTTGGANVAYMSLRECAPDHDLGAQLEKLRPRCADDKWTAVVQHLSRLVHMGRAVYRQFAENNRDLLRRAAGDRAEEFLNLKVDPANTTLFLDAGWPCRAGIFINLDGEAAPASAPGHGRRKARDV